MKAKDILQLVSLVLVLAMVYIIISQAKRNKMLEKIAAKAIGERDFYKRTYLNQLEALLIDTEAPNEILKELEGLKNFYEEIDIEVHKQLQTIISLVKEGHKEKAVFDLTKIIEVILKSSYEKEESKKCKVNFHKLLEYAENKEWISNHEHSYAKFIKKIRNEEGHELNVTIENREAYIAIFSGIQIAYKLTKK